jgi:hypothetical protein
MNATVVSAAQKKIVIISDMESGYRRGARLDAPQWKFYHRAVAVIELHRPLGLKVGIIVPISGAMLASRLANHFGGRITPCESLMSCDCQESIVDVCDCLRELLNESCIGIVPMVVPQCSAQALTDQLVNRLRRPKRHASRHDSLFVF